MEIASFVPAALAGYYALDATTHPIKSKIRRKLPRIKLKKVEVMPEIKIHHKNKTIHLHHWFSFTILLIVSVFVTNALLDSSLTRGFLVGGILQGLKFSDRGIIHHNFD